MTFNVRSLWITGNSCCGKTTRLASLIIEWMENQSISPVRKQPLILSVNRHGKKILTDTILRLNPLYFPSKIRTVSGLIKEDVILFYPLICEDLGLSPIVPLFLRSESEQDLATELWRNSLTTEIIGIFGNEYDCVRRILDFMLLATAGGFPIENIDDRLLQSNIIDTYNQEKVINLIQELILQWRRWCLSKGLLTYGLIYELYSRYLLHNDHYQRYLLTNYGMIFADDVDDYPAIFRDLGEFFLNHGVNGVFTYNQTGKSKLGYNADPDYLQGLANYCQEELLPVNVINSLGRQIETTVLDIIQGNSFTPHLPQGMTLIQKDLRGELLQATANSIIQSIHSDKIQPQDIAVIVPGLDEITRYTLVNSIEEEGIKVKVLNEKKALIAYSEVRSILTMLTLLYEGLGRFVTKEMVTEMLVILSEGKIDLVRGGLLTDYCFYPDLRSSSLLNVESFLRWDRLSYQSLQSYNQIRHWINQTKETIQTEQYNLLMVIDLIIKEFFLDRIQLNSRLTMMIRELRETVEHFWEIQERLKSQSDMNHLVAHFITLLRKGTITANPLPLTIIPPLQEIQDNAITIAPIYQYRQSRQYHRWQYWVDVSSSYWSQSSELFGSSIFLKSWQPEKFPFNKQTESEEVRMTRIIKDLLGRATEKIYLCHSTLDINGLEQVGKLFPLVRY